MSDEQMKPRFVDAVSNDPFDLAKLRLPQDFLSRKPRQKVADDGAGAPAGTARLRAGPPERSLPASHGHAQD